METHSSRKILQTLEPFCVGTIRSGFEKINSIISVYEIGTFKAISNKIYEKKEH